MNKTTVRDIAKETGVSAATVSRALNGMSGVSAYNRQIILAAAEKLGYAHTNFKKPINSVDANLIALFAPSLKNPFYADLLDNCIQRLSVLGHQPIIASFSLEKAQFIDVLDNLSSLPLKGLILLSALYDPTNYLDAIHKTRIPTVLLLNRPLDGFNGSTVIQDNFQAGYTATRHLIELGHKKIVFLNGPRSAPAMQDRINGYQKATANYGLICDSDWIFEGDLTADSGRKLAKRFLENQRSLPDALICANDLMAIGFMDEFKKSGKCIPEDISLIGFDDIMISGIAGIDLTTMRQNSQDMGRQTAELLHRRIINPQCQNENVIFDPKLVVRKTTAPKA